MSREKEKIRKVAPVAQRRAVAGSGKNNLETKQKTVAGGAVSPRSASTGKASAAGTRRAPPSPRFLRGGIFCASVRVERAVALSAPKGLVILSVFVLGVLFARTPLLFSAYPLGLGFLCASVRYFPIAAAGVFVGALSNGIGGLVYASASVILTAVRLIISLYGKKRGRDELFYTDTNVRMYLAAMSAFVCGLYCIIRNGFRYYDLFGSFLLISVTPLFTYLMASGAERTCRKNSSFNTAVCSVFAASVLFTLKDISLFGISLASVGCGILSIFVARKRGALYGTAAGTVFGFVSAPSMMHVFSILGLAVGLSRKSSLRISLLVALPLSYASAYAVSGVQGLFTALACVLISSALYLLADYFGVFDAAEGVLECTETPRIAKGEVSCEERFAALSESFRSLSEVCYALSDRYRRPDEAELRMLCDSVCEKYCARCRGASLCWNRDYASTSDVMGKVVYRLSEGKKITRTAIPSFFSSRCPSIDGIIGEINSGCAALTKKQLQGNRTEAFAMDYEAISALISRALEANSAETRINRRLTSEVRDACAGIFADAPITVTGKRHLRIRASGFDTDRGQLEPRALKEMLEKVCGFRLSMPEYSFENGRASVSLAAVRRYGVRMSFLRRPKTDGVECGDCVSVFENREDYYYAMLSDGMGSGSEAALTSNFCSVFLKKMLSAGNAKDISIEMLNGLVRSSRGENSATIDLFELDMLTGKASFIKSGAAPSFVKRGGRLFRIQSKTLPIGIVRAAEAEQVSYNVEAGDVIIMQSDGVAQSYEDCPWIANLLTRSWTDDLGVMCARILDAAEVNNAECDDRSVCLMKIVEIQ